jgi:hypothetical protein
MAQSNRPRNTPDPAESRERADPRKEPGLGQVKENKKGPVDRPERQEQNRAQNERHRERTADEATDQADAVDPRRSAADHPAGPGKQR